MKYGNSILVIGFLFWVFCGSALAISSRIYFGVPDAPVVAGNEFKIAVLADSDQPLNAYAVNFTYDPAALELEGFDTSRSVIDIIQSLPKISVAGNVAFKGGSTTPFKGVGGDLLSVRFKGLRAGVTALHFGNASFYLANGKGTRVVPQYADANIKAASSSGVAPRIAPAMDIPPPAITSLSFVDDPLNSSQKFLSYAVQDAGSGIRNILYKTKTFLFSTSPSPAMNPVVLPKNVWSASLMVMDGSGRIVEKTIYDWSALRMPLIFFLIVICLVGIAYAVRKKRMYNK